jgi:hypothetical protein
MLEIFILSVTLLYDYFLYRCMTESQCSPPEKKIQKGNNIKQPLILMLSYIIFPSEYSHKNYFR